MSVKASGLLPVTEKQFLQQVQDLARLFGWETYHPLWSMGSDPGWPDLTCVRPPRKVFAELKSEGRDPTPAQRRWLWLLAACGDEVHVWKPKDLERQIVEVLRGPGAEGDGVTPPQADWTHCPCGKRLVKLTPPASVITPPCGRCGREWHIKLSRYGELTILPRGATLMPTE